MTRTLVTGMSGTGKSTTIAVLATLGIPAVDLDDAQWSLLVPDDSPYGDAAREATDWRWRPDRVGDLLASADDLVVAGTSTDQGSYYGLLDHVVLLTVPEATARERLATRTSNDYGKHPEELARELALRALVEPLLRAGACLVLDTSTLPPGQVAARVAEHARTVRGCRCAVR